MSKIIIDNIEKENNGINSIELKTSVEVPSQLNAQTSDFTLNKIHLFTAFAVFLPLYLIWLGIGVCRSNNQTNENEGLRNHGR